MATQRLTMAQALIKFLKNQYIERDGVEQRFFAGCFGIFGHGIIGGIGQALQQNPDFRYRQTRNEQAMVHTAIAYAKVKNRLGAFVCTSSIGPGATNMVTGAATATINRLPVLLLPGDIFARRNVAPVLQQLESEHGQDLSVNDCFKPVSRYWDRINRPDQLICALPEAMRVLTSPADTGAVVLALPQDVQAEAYDYPEELFEKRVWHVPRNRPDREAVERAAQWIRASKRPMIVAGGGVLYSEATEVLCHFVGQTGIPVGETMAGKNSLRYDYPLNLGAVGVTGTLAANRIARDADLVIGIGTRYSDFTTCSKTAFQNPEVRFININVAEFDAFKHSAVPLLGDARETIGELLSRLEGYEVAADYRAYATALHDEWETEVDRIYGIRNRPLMSQGEVIGAVNTHGTKDGIMVCAAGSLPGDLHKLWRSHHARHFHMEYGYSCMGYEIAGGLGAKLADPDRNVYVMVGDGSYLMLSNEIITSIQESQKLIIVLLDSIGYNSIGGLSRSLGQKGFGTRYAYPKNGVLPDDEAGGDVTPLPVDLAANARSLGAIVFEVKTHEELVEALRKAETTGRTTVIAMQVDRYVGVPGYDSWWDVHVAEVSEMDSVRDARKQWEVMRAKERYFL
ncbi:MAG TPA: 3D-(3,5/4)-trihydroxycyclohexane-1,2-dione acylhydrolase (decyclizing) [Candidatus Hydrogenedentes bacterium]|nr:3D-(3,5/4)-trihydroxycyclohexane-1,2-dione acylhydrolase (decyclizing) [Candidatus Hydrogenedentota bacterium]HPC18434.1 3D-(3,5/4)-trihydroxycyclohexane-1,2-dione acylhydrolase (decyclizing) [Candidatus Hydrogenedentota bacterium]HRT19483.1 3D-(3,5/4)-trihydroxycyclohexane-1,2-dione acylhydrolase (decyclizing) [Candidatus Hydrogenedentota bacterium]HRT66938.1 3D-(3,5/4)-trihydroxycyclohexane-1,2-dione acylhydrolase (decyclizing) [Candidatus Hydrogenedentota bacterium]